MQDFPRLQTTRLLLRKLEYEDLSALVTYANNLKISQRIINIPYPYREPDAALRLGFVARGFKEKTRYVFAIILKESHTLIGEISLHLLDKKKQSAQLAYWLGEPFWNKGLTTEAAAAVVSFGFEQLKLDLIYADCRDDNPASERILQRIGLEKHHKQGNLLFYKLSSQDYQTTH